MSVPVHFHTVRPSLLMQSALLYVALAREQLNHLEADTQQHSYSGISVSPSYHFLCHLPSARHSFFPIFAILFVQPGCQVHLLTIQMRSSSCFSTSHCTFQSSRPAFHSLFPISFWLKPLFLSSCRYLNSPSTYPSSVVLGYRPEERPLRCVQLSHIEYLACFVPSYLAAV